MKKRKKAYWMPPPEQAPPLNKCRALVLSDGGEIRQKVLGEINAARTLLEKSQIEIQEYELTCEPNYRSWLSLEFREILEKTRSLVEDLQKKEAIFSQVDEISMEEGLHPGAAYELVSDPVALEAYRKKKEVEREKREAREAAQRSKRKDRFSSEEDDFFDEMADEFSRMFGEGGFFGGDAFPNFGQQSGGRSERSDDAEVKKCYREVVKLLHPDLAVNWTATEKTLWIQAQKAYHQGDLEGLREVVHSLNSDAPVVLREDRVSDLFGRLENLKTMLHRLKLQANQYRKTPAWRFSFKNGGALQKLRSKTEFQLVREYRTLAQHGEEIREDWEQLMDLHRRWKAMAGSQKSGTKKISKNPSKRRATKDPESRPF